ncbi:MAG: MBL fold metallo-hydrolase [Clostridia bacterium]|nr:MBL fold metallo-hydrolase [Clostridia bacterium]
MKLTFLGAAHEVTGSCTLLEACGKHLLIDCGMEQGADTYENCELPVLPADIDAVFLTHAHIDHSGKIPALVASGYSGAIYSTEATHSLCNIMLRDSAHIQESEAEWRNRKAQRSGAAPYVPQYTMADAIKTIEAFEPYPYEKSFSPFEGITVKFIDAGHLLGSASICFEINEDGERRTVVFSGDIGNVNRPLIRDPKPPKEADYVVIESTYGDRLHGERPDYISQLSAILQRTFDRGGNVVIPSFAVGRTQELLYLIRTIKDAGLVSGHDGFPVYVDSPLAVEATNIYAGDLMGYYDAETLELVKEGINPIHFDDLNRSITAADSKLINESNIPKVILSASGMCEAGRIRHHLKHNLWRPESTILFVGYQSDGTIGRKMLDGAGEVKLFGESIEVRAEIANLDGISGHADRDMLLSWLSGLSPRKVFVNHGEDSVCESFAATVTQTHGFAATAPHSGDVYDLVSGECIEKCEPVRKIKKSDATRRADSVYERLLSAGRRLMAIITRSRGSANKDLAKMADQINAMCDKFDR